MNATKSFDFFEEKAPVYKHDCEACTSLGMLVVTQENEPEEVFDLYHCANGMLGSVIGRYSSTGGDYISGLMIVKSMVKEMFSNGEATTVEEALEMMSQSDNVTLAVLATATQKSIERGLVKVEKLVPKL